MSIYNITLDRTNKNDFNLWNHHCFVFNALYAIHLHQYVKHALKHSTIVATGYGEGDSNASTLSNKSQTFQNQAAIVIMSFKNSGNKSQTVLIFNLYLR